MSNLRTSNNRDFFLPKKPASCIPFSQKIWKKLFFISWNYSCMSTHVKIRRQGCVNTNFNGLETLSAWLAYEAFQRLNLQRCEILRPPDDLCLMSTMFSTSVFTGAWNKQHQKFSFTCKNMKSPGLKLLPSNKMLLLLSVWWKLICNWLNWACCFYLSHRKILHDPQRKAIICQSFLFWYLVESMW